MQAILDFDHKNRLTPLLRELLALLCMDRRVEPQGDRERAELRSAEATLWRGKYKALAVAPVYEKQELL